MNPGDIAVSSSPEYDEDVDPLCAETYSIQLPRLLSHHFSWLLDSFEEREVTVDCL
jgi:hypothetical protein